MMEPDDIETLAPELTVAAICERDGRFLFVEETVGGRRVINQPAGHVEIGESSIDAVKREALEESGWHFQPDAVVGIYCWAPSRNRPPYLRIAYSGTCTHHEPGRLLDAGIIRTLWLDRDALQTGQSPQRSPMVLRCVDDYLRGTRHPMANIGRLTVPELLERAAVL